jgi:GNAT superfamily N-acetyltransferase
LRDAPYAFGSTFESEVEASEERWRAGIAGRARFVAALEGEVVGTVGGGETTVRGTAALTSLWVEPQARGRGIGGALIEAVLDWAKDSGYEQIVLWVVDGNSNAERLYERRGFRRTGSVQAVRPDDTRVEYEMSRAL